MVVTKAHIAKVVKQGNWIIRADNAGIAYGGFVWAGLGEWTEAPDWRDDAKCGGGLHGQDKNNGGFISGNRLLFCETEGKHCKIGDDKVKVKKAKILLINELPEGLQVGGSLNLSVCTGLTSLPEGLQVVGYLDLRGCTGLTSLPEGLQVGGYLDLIGCTGLTSLPEDLQVGGSIFYR